MHTTHNGFSAREDRSDGLDLRGLTWDGETVFDRLYFAVRDPWWRTVDMAIAARTAVETPDGFRIEVTARSTWPSHPVEVVLSYEAGGAEVVARATATALGEFDYRRIGFCLLLGAGAWPARPARSWCGGVLTEFTFPGEIVTRDQHDEASRAFHAPFDQLATTAATGTVAHYTFTGGPFEFEDQRNWTDASFKAYSVSTGLLHARTDDTFRQGVRLRVTPAPIPGPRSAPEPMSDNRISLGQPIGTVPSVDLFHRRSSPHSYRPPGGFPELNARRPRLDGADGIELAVNGAVHAADDDSVMETALMHGTLVAQTRALYPGVPVTLAPVSFLDRAGDWRDPEGQYCPQPPDVASQRARGDFGAAWVVASAASALPAGAAQVRYLDAAVPPDSPAGRAVGRLRSARGADLLAVTAPPSLAVLAVRRKDGVVLAVANTTPDPVTFTLPDGNSATVQGFRSAWFTVVPGA